ncbi:MAG TPA: radical SAM protein, partial [Burkholderiales bacterium]|nr:radical SAM protein [Burkholderiales bacterium]
MHYPASELVIDPLLIRSHDVGGPRYTSYPTADRLVEAFGELELAQWLAKRNIGGFGLPLSVYVHLPFCDTLCYYCGCNKVVTRDHSRSARYVQFLEKELALLDRHLGGDRQVSQMHWGGGTPTFLSREEMKSLCDALKREFVFNQDMECSIEVDPRRCAPGTLAFLGELGFNRVSIGVQDFDAAVQKAVHRAQSEAETRRVIEEARQG